MFYQKSSQEILKECESSLEGLYDFQVKKHSAKYGKNELIEKKKDSPLVIFLKQFQDLLVIILIFAASVSGLSHQIESTFVIIAVIVLILASLEIGTKVPFISLILLICVVLYSCIVKLPNRIERKVNIRNLIATLITIVGILLVLPFSPIAYNLGNVYNIAIPNVFSLGNKQKPNTEPNKNLQTKEEVQTAVYSSRNVYLAENLEKYKDSNSIKKFFGIGYLREQPETKEITELKLVEIDYYDIFICHGIVGAIVYLIPFIYLFVIFIRKIISNIKLVLLDREYILREYSIVIALFIAFTAGHVFTAPAPALFLTLCIVQYCKLLEEEK